MKKYLKYLALLSALLSFFWVSCQEEITQTDDPLSEEQLEKKDKIPCPPIEERVNIGTPLECESGFIPVEFTLWAGQHWQYQVKTADLGLRAKTFLEQNGAVKVKQ